MITTEHRNKVLTLIVVILVFIALSRPVKAEVCEENIKQYYLIEDIQLALHSQSEEALKTIVKYGTDSRYYVMVRGWLVQYLAGVESQKQANKDPSRSEKSDQETLFLKRAIKLIDLE